MATHQDQPYEKETKEHVDSRGSTSDHESGLDPEYERQIMYVVSECGPVFMILS